MHWFYVEKSQIADGQITITGEDRNHICNVLRMQPGEKLTICDGEGTDYVCQIGQISREQVTARIVSFADSTNELPVKLVLFQGLPKKEKMELIIQKAVELGVTQIVPVAMKRCVARIEDKKKEEKKLARWQQIAEAAAKQSQRGMIPQIHPLVDFKEAVSMASQADTFLFPYEQAEGMEDAGKWMTAAAEGKSAAVMIGPEGGFEESEVAEAKNAGGRIISLGRRILRTETAGMTTLSILMFTIEQRARAAQTD